MPLAMTLLSIASQLFQIFASKSKAAPIVAAAAPVVLDAMSSAQSKYGNGTGTDKLAYVDGALDALVKTGQVISHGGQVHTFEELDAARPLLHQLIAEVKTAVNDNAKSVENLQVDNKG